MLLNTILLTQQEQIVNLTVVLPVWLDVMPALLKLSTPNQDKSKFSVQPVKDNISSWTVPVKLPHLADLEMYTTTSKLNVSHALLTAQDVSPLKESTQLQM